MATMATTDRPQIVTNGGKKDDDFLADITFNEEGHRYIRDHWEAFNSRPQELEKKEHELEAEKIAELAKEEFEQLGSGSESENDKSKSKNAAEIGVQTKEAALGEEIEKKTGSDEYVERDMQHETTKADDKLRHFKNEDKNSKKQERNEASEMSSARESPAYKAKHASIEEKKKKNSIDEVLEKYRNNVANNDRIFVDEEDKTAMFTEETLKRNNSGGQQADEGGETKQLLNTMQSGLENAAGTKKKNNAREKEVTKDALEEVKEKYGGKRETAEGTVENRPQAADGDTGTKRDITDKETREAITADEKNANTASETKTEMTKDEEERAKVAERKKKEFKKDMLIMDMGKY